MSSYSQRTNQAIALKLHCFRHISRIEVRLYVLTVSPRPVRIFFIMGFPKDLYLVLSYINYIHYITQ